MGDTYNGAFLIDGPNKMKLQVIAGCGLGWDHVSVSLKNRCPNWAEMSFIHRLFFKEDEVAYQLHVPGKDHINVHENVLHLWRPHDENIPLPEQFQI